MEKSQMCIIIALLICSVAVLVVPAIVHCVHRFTWNQKDRINKNSSTNYVLVFSMCLIASIWCLRYAVGYFSVVCAESGAHTLTWWEEIFNSLVHSLQTFSMDESYTEYIFDGKAMFATIFGEDSPWIRVYGLYASVLNFVAPIAGGAILLDIIASVFPGVRLRMSNFAFWREKCYFSELNEASLALAKSITLRHTGVFKRPVIIFTDTYVDKETEISSELLKEAKMIGAICVKDDLLHVKKTKLGMRTFFLIDEAELGNLKTLANLANSINSTYLKESEIYLFTETDAYVQVERRICDKLVSDFSFTEKEMPTIIPVQCYRNLISNLLVDIPLYEPLIGKERKKDKSQDLSVTILGTGHIGTQMFLTTYWLGQILDCNLKINVLSKETEEEFWSKIDYINPEIRHTTIKDDPILRINRKGDMAKVYCEVTYLECDMKSSKFMSYLSEENKGNQDTDCFLVTLGTDEDNISVKFMSCLTEENIGILDTDYFLVALGTDEDNISVANTIRRYVGEHHIKTDNPLKTVIAYVVYDSELSETLNREKYYKYGDDCCDIYMQAIGSVQDVYSVKNICLTEYKPFAQKTHDSYNTIQSRDERAKTHTERMNDDYKYWANLARAMHIKYKVYSMGMLKVSLFDYPDSYDTYVQELAKAYDEYKKIVRGDFQFNSKDEESEHLELLHRMAWLEHRRWNAFTRVKGFRSTTDYCKYAVPDVKGSYKQMDIKLHPCLVECDDKGIKAQISSKGIIDEDTLFQCESKDDFDLLDDLSYDLYNEELNGYDFKQYDYPISTF